MASWAKEIIANGETIADAAVRSQLAGTCFIFKCFSKCPECGCNDALLLKLLIVFGFVDKWVGLQSRTCMCECVWLKNVGRMKRCQRESINGLVDEMTSTLTYVLT